MDVITTLIHGDEAARWDAAVTPSIAQGTTWEFETGDDLEAAAREPLYPYFYNRHGNPNHEQVAAVVATLEGAERAMLTATGMSAATTLVLSIVRAGDHVVAQRSMYGGVTKMVHDLLPRFGVECTEVDQGDVSAFAEALRPNTTLILLESPSNPLLEVTDLAAVADLARRHGALTVADNTFATPINQRPLELGVDLVWHSATKYMGGHADLMAGVIAGREDLVAQAWKTAKVVGGVLSPFNAWLLLRGLRTLSLRMERHNANAMKVAEAVYGHPAVAKVHYPGLASHRNHEVAARQMRGGFGGVLSLELEGGAEAVETFITALRYAKRGSSLGSVTTLVINPAAMWGNLASPEELAAAGVTPGLVRFACGIEHYDDLIEDVVGALDGVAAGAPAPTGG